MGKRFTDLDVWQKSIKATVAVYQVLKYFPKEEKYALSDQLRRSSVSISSNIAEGQARGSDKAFINHLYISLGSSAEVQSQLYLSVELGYVSLEIINDVIEKLREVDKMLQGLIGYLDSRSNF